MIPYQLATGKTTFVNPILLLDGDENDIRNLVADDYGFTVNDPFYLSTIDIEEGEENASFITLELPDLADVPEIEINEEID